MKPQFLLLWASARGFSCGGCCVFTEWVIQESTCTHEKFRVYFQMLYVFTPVLLSLTDQPCDRLRENYTGVGISGDSIHLKAGYHTHQSTMPAFFFIYMISILSLWANYLACVLFLLLLLLLSRIRRVRLCNLMDSSPPGSRIPGILQERILEWVAISFSNAWEWRVKLNSLSHVQLYETPWTVAYQAPPSVGFSRQEYWCEFPLPSLACVLSGLIDSILDLLSSRPTHFLIF